MAKRFGWFGVGVVLFASACHGESAQAPHSAANEDVDLPGVDTSEFTPREKHEFSRYVEDIASPCPAVTLSIAQCVLQKRECSACVPAARAIAVAVRDGMASEQVKQLYDERFGAGSVKTIPIDGSPTRGAANAPVTVVEFADFECPFCQKLAPELDAAWEKRKNDVRFVFKYMPLAMHPHGEIAARAAIAAAAQGKVWEMHRLLFASEGRLDPSDLEGYATSLGLDLERFRADMQSADATARIAADRKLADTLNVRGTPTLFIDGREYDRKVDMADWLDGDIAIAKSHSTR